LIRYKGIERININAAAIEKEKDSLRIPISTSLMNEKSKKYKGNEYSVDVRGKEGTKMKTENSCSLNKSRPSRKGSTKPKKHT
jgi:hypothetical protein